MSIKLLSSYYVLPVGLLDMVLLKQCYSMLMQTMEDINMRTHDEYGGGILHLMEKILNLVCRMSCFRCI